MRVAYITAGAGGMICGSCLSDNALVRALHRGGIEAVLVPLYTPIRTEDEDESLPHVFLGGLNVYLAEKLPGYRLLPAAIRHWLDRPGLIRRLTARGVGGSPRLHGRLTLSMLAGTNGPQRAETLELVHWLVDSYGADIVHLSNVLIAGCVGELRQRSRASVIVSLQGDDVFLESLPPAYRQSAIERIGRLAQDIDQFVVYSDYYRDFMSGYLGIDREKIAKVPLGIEGRDFLPPSGLPDPADRRPRTIGYLARIAPEKGLHLLVDAFIRLKQDKSFGGQFDDVQLAVAGWLGAGERRYARQQFARLDRAGLGGDYRYWGVVDRTDKIRFLHALSLLSVPTVYREPKGLFVLEAMAAGVPVVEPAHGAFPELLQESQGGLLCEPLDAVDLARQLARLLADRGLATGLGQAGRRYVRQHRTIDQMAGEMVKLYRNMRAKGPQTG